VLGTIAGDDTILLICRSADGGNTVARQLLDLAQQTRQQPHTQGDSS
jgi:transcriptional regulator of arginine metabolism